MPIHGVSSVGRVKTPTPATEKLLQEKKQYAQKVIDRGVEQSHANRKVIDLQTRMANQSRGRKKDTDQPIDAPTQQALHDRETVLNYRHKLYNANNQPLAMDMSEQRRQAITTYGPVYQHNTALTIYSSIASIGYQQSRKIAATLDMLA